MLDPMTIRLNETLFRERLEAAAQARKHAADPAPRSLLALLRQAIVARMLPPTPRPTARWKLLS